MTDKSLLASANTLAEIRASIASFYGDETKDLIWRDGGFWTVHSQTTGRECPGVRVICKNGRYRFEAVQWL